MASDTNKDGFISVLEGAAPYGPIKVNLTNPPTPRRLRESRRWTSSTL
ncbi:MAG TPA: hypothetical protein VF669_15170 [Tepidisphaeraceae bacterium]|jgi:hypothetical protein